jgi:hypothetical protein
MSMSKPLTFGEIPEGSKFIGFPLDGDDSGHGGYRGKHYIFTKLRLFKGKNGENAVKDCNGTLSCFPDGMQVLPVE